MKRNSSNLPNEAEQGAALWVAQSGSNPISSTFGTTGGWEIGWAVTATRNLIIGGMGLELDGSGLSPYGRLVHNNSLSTVNTGIAKNIYADFSGRDASAQPSWFAGFVDDAFKVRRLAGSDAITSNNFSSLLSVSASGTLAVTGSVGIGTTTPLTALSIVGSGDSGINIGGFFGSGYGAISLNGTADGTNYNFLSGNSVTDNSLYLNRASGGAIHFREANGTDQMTILTGGNVGIGTTTPYSKLTTWGTGSLFEAVTNSSSTVFSIGQNGATTTNFAISNLANTLLSTNANGSVVATTSIGVNYLSGILPIANGGTATSTQVTNGVNYFDGTRITSGTALTFDGTTLTTPRGAFSSTSGTTTIAAGQGLTVGSTQFVLQQGSGRCA
ncbi:hypothetical protein HYT05_01675 [Candidatus Kaiserbacteria bacterium]|nr:hypothetical protein [Candidatus Kaiserbacteria bacterium]